MTSDEGGYDREEALEGAELPPDRETREVARKRYDDVLEEEFEAPAEEREQVVAQALRLARSRVFERGDFEDGEFTIEGAVSSMQAAPGHLSLTGKWNWWIGLLDNDDALGMARFRC